MQQNRARYALAEIKRVLESNEMAQGREQDSDSSGDRNKKMRAEYKSYAAAFPAMIHMNGLGQAAAFYKSKGGTHARLYKLLSDWLCRDDQPFSGQTDLINAMSESDMQTYRLAQAEAQALMDWVKKFAKAYLVDEK